MANYWQNTGKLRCWAGATGEVDLVNDTIKVMAWEDLTGATNADEFIDDMDPGGLCEEVTSTGYTGGFGGAGRLTLGSPALTVDQGNNRAEFDCANPVWTSISQAGSETWVGFSIVKEITTEADSPVIATIDTGTGLPLTPNGSNITLTIDAEGLLHIT